VRAIVDLDPCGTPAAYRRHLRNGEQPCGPCGRANAERKRSELAAAHEQRANAGIEVAIEGHRVVLSAPVDDMRGIAAAVLDRALHHERQSEVSVVGAEAAGRRFRAIHKRLASAMRRAGVAA
jgi:hypothetical protein